MYPLPLITRHVIRRNSHSALRLGDNSYVNLGKNYEEKCKRVISKVFDEPVRMVGGANDGGIDLIWSKSFKCKLAVEFIGQCKVKVTNRVAPEVCRALDGVLSKRPTGSVGCLISNVRPSVMSIKSIKESSFPLIYFNISDCFDCEYIKEIIINQKFKDLYSNIQILPVRHRNYTHYILRFT